MLNSIPLTATKSDVQLMRAYYFFFYAAAGVVIPFLNLFYSEIGLTGAQIGIVSAVGAAITLTVAPLWTRYSENARRPKELLQVALLLTAAGCLWLGYQHLFLGVLLVAIFRALVGAGILPISDAIALVVTQRAGVGYGGVRVWGSAGWIAVGFFTGKMIEHFGWLVLLGFAGAMYVLTALTLVPLQGSLFEHETQKQATPVMTRHLLRQLVQPPLMLGVGAMILVITTLNTGVLLFEGVFLADLGAPKALIGIISIMGAVVELPFMILADRIIRRRGTVNVLFMAMMIYVVVRLLVFFVPTIPILFLARAAGGIGFSFLTIPLTVFFSEQVGERERRTVMALYTVTLINLIGMIVPPIAGAIYDLSGARSLYLLSALGYVIGGCILYYTWQHRRK